MHQDLMRQAPLSNGPRCKGCLLQELAKSTIKQHLMLADTLPAGRQPNFDCTQSAALYSAADWVQSKFGWRPAGKVSASIRCCLIVLFASSCNKQPLHRGPFDKGAWRIRSWCIKRADTQPFFCFCSQQILNTEMA